MKKIFFLLVINLFIGQVVLAEGLVTTPSDNSFRQYKDVSNVDIVVPTVVELPLDDVIIGVNYFEVWNSTIRSLEPYYFKQEGFINQIPTTLTTSLSDSSVNVRNMNDGNVQTYAEFLLPETGQGQVQINIASNNIITASSLSLLLDQYVALPNSIEIRARVNGQDQIVLSSKRGAISGSTVYFPKTTSNYWTINLTYSQPLRITELKLKQENLIQTNFNAIRFLAQPNHQYRVYMNPDYYVRGGVVYKEGGDLYSNQDVKILPAVTTITNATFKPADRDGDGIIDIHDNCVDIVNPDQLDVDANGRGDVCDDFDKDKIINANDNCPNNPNRNQADIDGDDIGDACDTEESRLTEKYKWIPWLGIGFAAIVLIVLLIVTTKSMRNGGGKNINNA